MPDCIYNYACISNCLKGEWSTANRNSESLDFDKVFKEDALLNGLGNSEEASCKKEKYIQMQNLPSFTYSWLSKIKLWLQKKVLQRLFPRGIFFHPGQLLLLERCSISRSPFLFLPPRQSLLDSMIVKAALKKTNKRFDKNTVCALQQNEENSLETLSFSLFDFKEWTEDDIVWAVQQSTIRALFSKGYNILAYLENNFEENGQPIIDLNTCILDHALECIYAENFQTDIQIVPVGISYELPKPEIPTTAIDYIKIFLGLWPSYGSVRVDFDQPFSLREFNETWDKKLGDYNEVHEDKKWNLSKHTMFTSWKCSRLHATQLVAFLNRFDDISYLDTLIEELKNRGKSLAFKTSDYNYAIEYAQPLLKTLNEDCLEYMANSVASVFFNESVVITALGSLIISHVKVYTGMNAEVTVKRYDLVERCKEAFDLLTFENLPCLPCKQLTDVIHETFELLKLREIIFIKEKMQSEQLQERWSRRMAQNIEKEMNDYDSDYENNINIQDETVFHVSLKKENMKQYRFLLNLLRPVFKAYRDVICYLNQFDKEDQISIADLKLIMDNSKEQQIDRIICRLIEMAAINYCENYTCVHVNTISLGKLLHEVQKYVM